MAFEFTQDEINQVIRAARAFAPGFAEEHYRWLVDCQHRLEDLQFFEGAHVVNRFEQERGISCNDIFDALEKLVAEKTEMEVAVDKIKQEQELHQSENCNLTINNQRLMADIEQASSDLSEIKAEIEREKQGLIAIQDKAKKAKKRIQRELDKHRQEADVSQVEIQAAMELKTQVGKYGFSLEEMLGLSLEFAGHQDSRERLVNALETHKSLVDNNKSLEKWAADRRKVLEYDLATFESRKSQGQSQVNDLEEYRDQLKNTIAGLQTDVKTEEEMRRFYQTYQPVSGFMQYLLTLKQVYFYRCNNPFSVVTNVFNTPAVARFCTDRPVVVCPHCGLKMVAYDETPYQLLNCEIGSPIRFVNEG
jgi:hypothetical protein